MCIVFAFKKGLVSKQCQFFKVCVRDWILSNFFHWKIQIKNHKLNNILVEMGISDLGFFFKGFTFKYYFIQYYLTIILYYYDYHYYYIINGSFLNNNMFFIIITIIIIIIGGIFL
jgi:hypothetical protein